MHSDTRTGLALGILAVGLIGALFFRNDSSHLADYPQLRDPDKVDARIAELDVAPYPSNDSDSGADHGSPQSATNLFADQRPRVDRANPAPPAPIALPREQIAMGRTTRTTSRETDGTTATGRESQVSVDRSQNSGPSTTIESRVSSTQGKSTSADHQRYRDYTVQHGDTLSGIAHRLLGASHRFGEIYEANRDRLPDPHRLRPHLVIRIPVDDVAESPVPPSPDGSVRRTATLEPQEEPARPKRRRRLVLQSIE